MPRKNRIEKVGFYYFVNRGIARASIYHDKNEIVSYRKIPEKHDEIVSYFKIINGINHPAVMYKKSVVEKAGGYNFYRRKTINAKHF